MILFNDSVIREYLLEMVSQEVHRLGYLSISKYLRRSCSGFANDIQSGSARVFPLQKQSSQVDFHSTPLNSLPVDTRRSPLGATFSNTITMELAVETLGYLMIRSVNNKPPRSPVILRVVFYANARAQIIV